MTLVHSKIVGSAHTLDVYWLSSKLPKSVCPNLIRTDLGPIAEKIGYPLNGMIFVIEALVRGKLIEDSETTDTSATILPSLNTKSACYVVYHSAVERFGTDARTILERWNITKAGDIGNILFPLVETGILTVSEPLLPEALQNRFLLSGADSLFNTSDSFLIEKAQQINGFSSGL